MSITTEEKDELLRLEAAFDEAGGRGVEMADRLDFLRTKASRPTVADFLLHIMTTMSPEQAESTFIFASEDDEGVYRLPDDCKFVTVEGFIEAWGTALDPENA